MSYTVELSSQAQHYIQKQSISLQNLIIHALEQLADEPRPRNVKKMRGYKNRWRIREGNYRIVYEIYDDRLVVLVVDIDHRRNIYRR